MNCSCWPVITTIYNLPPWLCMRRKHLMLTMLISGPKQPGYDINTYLAPLIDDLKILWEEGVQCFDAYKEEYFCEPSYCGLSMISLYTVIYVGVVSKVLRLVQYVEKRLLQSDYNMEKKCIHGTQEILAKTSSLQNTEKEF